MSTRWTIRSGTLALIATVAASAWAQPDRMLVRHGDVTARVAVPVDCGREIPVTVEAQRPDFFGENPGRMQSLTDSVQAILRFECPRVERVRIEGYLRGLDEPVYEGVARLDDRWRVTTRRVLKFDEAAGRERRSSPPVGGDFVLAGIRLGMTVEEFSRGVAEAFGSTPSYDPVAGVASLRLRGCPSDYRDRRMEFDPQTGWACLDARFTDRRVPRLYRFDYVQVVEGRSRDARRALIEEFGEPTVDRQDDHSREHVMSWEARDRSSTGDASEGGVLEAALWPSGDVVVVDIGLRARHGGAHDPSGDSGRPVELKL